jgi:hypothetical protein
MNKIIIIFEINSVIVSCLRNNSWQQYVYIVFTTGRPLCHEVLPRTLARGKRWHKGLPVVINSLNKDLIERLLWRDNDGYHHVNHITIVFTFKQILFKAILVNFRQSKAKWCETLGLRICYVCHDHNPVHDQKKRERRTNNGVENMHRKLKIRQREPH